MNDMKSFQYKGKAIYYISPKYILKTYLFEYIIIGGSSGIVAAVIYPCLVKMFNYLFERGYINIMTSALEINNTYIIMLIFAGVLLFTVSAIPALFKIGKIDPIVSLKRLG